jgi:hypothetical protein
MANLKARIEALEALAGFAAKTHCVWNTGDAEVAARIAELIAAGARPDDKFLVVSWLSGPEVPMRPDPFRVWPSRNAPPPAANDG